MLRTALAVGSSNDAMPSFEERHRSVTGSEPQLQTEHLEETRDMLRRGLSVAGFETSNSRSLPETMDAWRASRIIPVDQFAAQVAAVNARLLALSRENVLRRLDFGIPGYSSHLDDVAFDGNRFEFVRVGDQFTGSSAYLGGQDEHGRPRLSNLFEYNTDHPMTEDELLGFAAHESFPGHYMNMSIIDLLRRAGLLKEETAIGTMCTAQTAFQEGWAQNALLLALGGSREALQEALGPAWEAIMAMDDLQDFAKNDASIHHQRDGMPLEELAEMMRNQYILPPYIVEKMTGVWAGNKIVGPMYGGSYGTSKRRVAAALERYGHQNVIETGSHLRGFVDMQRFEEEVGKKAA